MGAAASIALAPMVLAAAAVCPPAGVVAVVFGAGVALGAALRVKAPHAAATDFVDGLDVVCTLASEAVADCFRAAKNAACSAFERAKGLATSACHGVKGEVACDCGGASATKKKEAPAAPPKLKRREVDRAAQAQAQRQRAGSEPDLLTVLNEALSSHHDVASSGPGVNKNSWERDPAVVFPANHAAGALATVRDSSVSALLATRAARRASEVMALLETLKPLEEELGASIPPEAKSCICVIAAAASVCCDVFSPPHASAAACSPPCPRVPKLLGPTTAPYFYRQLR